MLKQKEEWHNWSNKEIQKITKCKQCGRTFTQPLNYTEKVCLPCLLDKKEVNEKI